VARFRQKVTRFGQKTYKFVKKQVFGGGDAPKWKNRNFSEECGAKNKRNTLSRPVGARDHSPVRKRGDKYKYAWGDFQWEKPPNRAKIRSEKIFSLFFSTMIGE